MSAIAQLKALLGMDTGNYKAGMRDAEGATKKFQGTLKSVGRMLGVAFSVGTVIQFGRSLVTWASNASEAAQNAGVLTSEMIALNRVGLQAGLQVGDMGTLLEKLQNRLYEAAKGNKDATDSFAQIGLSVADLAGMDPAAMLEAVAKAAADSNIPLQTLSDIFGEKLGTKAMTALMDIAENGLPSVSKAAAEAADKIEVIGDRWSAMMDRIKEGAVVGGEAIATTLWRFGKGVLYAQGLNAQRLMKGEGRALLSMFNPVALARSGGLSVLSGMAGDAGAVADKAVQRATKAADTTTHLHNLINNATIQRVADWSAADLAARKRIRDQAESSIDRLRGQMGGSVGGSAGIQVDQMARMGGFTGRSLGNLNVASRGFELQRESNRIQTEIAKLTRDMNEALQDLRDAGGTL